MKELLLRLRDACVRAQVRRAGFPEFSGGEMLRWRIEFSGRVQKVGFRQELRELALRLGLIGWCRNLENGQVLAELQGTQEKICAAVSFMEGLKRIRIDEITVQQLAVQPDEQGFAIDA